MASSEVTRSTSALGGDAREHLAGAVLEQGAHALRLRLRFMVVESTFLQDELADVVATAS